MVWPLGWMDFPHVMYNATVPNLGNAYPRGYVRNLKGYKNQVFWDTKHYLLYKNSQGVRKLLFLYLGEREHKMVGNRWYDKFLILMFKSTSYELDQKTWLHVCKILFTLTGFFNAFQRDGVAIISSILLICRTRLHWNNSYNEWILCII